MVKFLINNFILNRLKVDGFHLVCFFMVMVLGAVLFDCYGIGVFEFAVTCFDFVFSFLIYFCMIFSNWIGSSHS